MDNGIVKQLERLALRYTAKYRHHVKNVCYAVGYADGMEQADAECDEAERTIIELFEQYERENMEDDLK